MKKIIQKRIREYRKKEGLNLRQLAERVGCTSSYISQVEKGHAVPSLSMVGKLAKALNINVIDLFNEELDKDQSHWHLRNTERKIINYPDGKITSQLLVERISTKKMEPLITEIKPGGTSDRAERMTHPPGTEELVLVLKGEVVFYLNDREIHLLQGDTLSFDGTIPHRWVNKGKDKATVLFVFSPPIW